MESRSNSFRLMAVPLPLRLHVAAFPEILQNSAVVSNLAILR